jgi:hypothetical protein
VWEAEGGGMGALEGMRGMFFAFSPSFFETHVTLLLWLTIQSGLLSLGTCMFFR